MRMITFAGAARRLMMVVFGATLATSAIGLELAQASTKSYQVNGRWYSPHGGSGYDETGTASYYGPGFHGRKTANGETYDQWGMTAAHKTLPLGSHVYVTNQRSGKTVKVRINDRGPFVGGRIIDLSTHVAEVLGISGLGQVRVRTASAGAPSEEKSEKRRTASKAKDDDDDKAQRKAKVKVASASDTSEKPRKSSSRKSEDEPATQSKEKPTKEAVKPVRTKYEVREYGGMAEAVPVGETHIPGAQLVRKLETVAVAEVSAQWRRAVASVHKS